MVLHRRGSRFFHGFLLRLYVDSHAAETVWYGVNSSVETMEGGLWVVVGSGPPEGDTHQDRLGEYQ